MTKPLFPLLPISILPLFLPTSALAQQLVAPNDFRDVIIRIIELIQGAIGLGWAFIIAGFVYGVYKFLINFEDEKAREEGKRMMVWSLIGTTVMLSIYGILMLLGNTLTGGGGGWGIPALVPPAF